MAVSSLHNEQLRFNLNVSPDPVNMTTRFKLKPTPVVLHKINQQLISPPPLSFDDRMKLASRLARRELERKSSSLPTNPDSKPHPPNITETSFRPHNDLKPHLPHTSRPPTKPKGHSRILKGHSRTVSFDKPSNKINGSVVMATTEDSGIEVSETEDVYSGRVNNDMRKLREELIGKLKGFPLPSHYNSTVIEKKEKDDSDRLQWIGEIDKERTRELKRKEEQSTRNTRLLYQLQQKIKGAQIAIRKASSETMTTKKRSYAVQQLTTAHRTAIRTLTALTNNCDPIVTKELISLLELLASLSSRLSQSHEEEGELLLVIHELKESLNEDYRITNELKRKSEEETRKEMDTKCNDKRRKKKKKLPPKLRGVLLSRYNQRPPRPFNNTPHLPSYSSPKEHKSTSITRTTVPHLTHTNSKCDELSLLQREVNRQGWLEAKHVHDIRTVQEETNNKLKQLEELIIHSMKRPETHPQSEPHPDIELHPRIESHLQSEPHPCIELHPNSEPHPQSEPHLKDPVVQEPSNVDRILYENMMKRLHEIEREKNEIKQKWSGNITYSDDCLPVPHIVPPHSPPPHSLPHTLPPHSPPPHSLPHTLSPPPHSLPHSLPHTLSPPPHSLPHSPPPLHSLPHSSANNTISHIMDYRDRHIEYLKLTETNGDTDRCNLIDNICTDLMNDLMTEVVQDIDSALDNCVLELYNEEFHKPS